VVDEPVPHAGGRPPRHVRQGTASIGADVLGGLADDLDELGQSQAEQLVIVQIRSLLARAVGDSFARRLGEVTDTDPVLHLSDTHKAGGTAGVELDEDVDVARRAEVVAQDRAEQSEPTNSMTRGEGAQHDVVDGQSPSEIRAVMMPEEEYAVDGAGSANGGLAPCRPSARR